jgi:hypothetical protein
MKLIVLFVFFLVVTARASDSTQVQSRKNKVEHPIRSIYTATGTELIFSFARVSVDSFTVDNKLRFSLFPHIQQQYHFNFNKTFGIYFGISLINIGFRNEFTHENQNTTFELRQRALAFGIPLAVKLGNMKNGNFIALGATAEIMTQYKYKYYYQGEKTKNTAWFSDKVNIFNPSVFVDLRNNTGGYIRLKYYLFDFLSEKPTSYSVSGQTEIFTLTPRQSSLFYLALGSTFMKKRKPKKLTLDDV